MNSRKPSLPKASHVGIANEGVQLVGLAAYRSRERNGLGCIYRNQGEADGGIDGHIEVVDVATGEFTGKLIGVQIKTGPSYFRSKTADGWTVPIAKNTVHYWRQYSVPVVLVLVDAARSELYWALASSGVFAATKTHYKIPVSHTQRVDASSADALVALAAQGTPELVARLRQLADEMSATVAAELVRHRAAWRQGRRRDVRAWLTEFTQTPERSALLDGPVAAAVFRFAAATALDDGGDYTAAEGWANEARRRDPTGDDSRLRAALLRHAGRADAALGALAASPAPATQLYHASILLAAGRAHDAASILDAVASTSDAERADVSCLRAYLHATAGEWDAAQAASEAASALDPTGVAIRQCRAMLAYVEGITPAARGRTLPARPHVVPTDALRGDQAALRAFEFASSEFRDLLTLDWTPGERRHLEVWHLAALCANPHRRAEAITFARTVLARDAAHPYVLHWAIADGLLAAPEDALTPHIDALKSEVERTQDLEDVVLYLEIRHGMGDDASICAAVGAWLDGWRERFDAAGELATWALWRARAYLAARDLENARAILAQATPEVVAALEAEFLVYTAMHMGNPAGTTAVLAYRAAQATRFDDFRHLFLACHAFAEAGAWTLARQHVDRYLALAPTARVRWLALVAHFNTNDPAWCRSVLDEAIAAGDARDDLLTLRRMRAEVRLRLGDAPGALEDLRQFLGAVRGQSATRDLFMLARVLLYAGRTPELVACARELATRTDLAARDALKLVEVLVHDDASVAVELWTRANAQGVADADVSSAVLLGFQLGLDAEVGPLHARMARLAAAGAPNVRAFTLDELLAHQRTWQTRRDRVYEQYQRGETGTHLLAEFLHVPLVRFYHAIPEDTEAEPMLRHQFPLQLRDGSRGVPRSGDIAAQGRLALDLSALLLAAHLDILNELEAEFAPIRLSPNALVALREQRDRLKPHQPSQLQTNRVLLKAERQRKLHVWHGDLPTLDPETAAAAKHWGPWVALLERARRERGVVLDLPLQAEHPRYGRPVSVAGAARVATLVTVDTLREFLVSVGALDARDPRARSRAVHAMTTAELVRDEEDEHVEGRDHLSATAPAASRNVELVAQVSGDPVPSSIVKPRLVRGGVVYLTESGADAVAAADLIDAAASVLTLRVDASDQAARRAVEESVEEVNETAVWMERLLRRVSAGLDDGRYALLPTQAAAGGQGDDAEDADDDDENHSDDTDDDDAEENEEASTRHETDGHDVQANARKTLNEGHGATLAAAESPRDEGCGLPATEGEEATPERTNEVDAAVTAPATDTEPRASRPRIRESLALHALTDLAALPAGTVDAVWLDDRWIGRHAYIGSARLVDVLQVVAALVAKGRLTAAQRWTIHHRLRSGNVRVVPLMADDILYHLRGAPIQNGEVVETPALRVLRQYAAALVYDASMLRMPSAAQLASGEIAELDVLRAYNSAVRESIAELWGDVRGPQKRDGRADAQARSAWIVSNLYIDLGLLRAHLLRTNPAAATGVTTDRADGSGGGETGASASTAAGDETVRRTEGKSRKTSDAESSPAAQLAPAISALDGAALLLIAAQLVEPHESRAHADDLASTYAEWVYRTLLEERMRRDPAFRAALLVQLRRLLATWPDGQARDGETQHMARIVAGWVYDAMPEALRDALEPDAELMEILGRRVEVVVTIGPWAMRVREFAVAVAGVFAHPDAGPDTDGTGPGTGEIVGGAEGGRSGLPIPLIESDPPEVVFLSQGGPEQVTLRGPEGTTPVRWADNALGILAPERASRARVCDAMRSTLDLDGASFEQFKHELVESTDAPMRFERLMRAQTGTLSRRYADMKTRWLEAHSIQEADLRVPSGRSVLHHLRLKRLLPLAADASEDRPGPMVELVAPPRAKPDVGLTSTAASTVGQVAEVPETECAAADFSDAWEEAGRTLVADEGVGEAYHRMTALPVALPAAVMDAIRALAPMEQRRFVRAALARPHSPVSAVHLLRILAVLGVERPAYRRIAERLLRQATHPNVIALWQLCRAVAVYAYEDLLSRLDDPWEWRDHERAPQRNLLTEGDGVGIQTDARLALVGAWFHAHNFTATQQALGWDATPLLSWVEERTAGSIRTIFAQHNESRRDVADPRQVSIVRAAAGGLQYVAEGTAFLATPTSTPSGDVLGALFAQRDVDVSMPHVDLLRDLDAHPNALGAWFRPRRWDDGTLAVGAYKAVAAPLAPSALVAVAIDHLRDHTAKGYVWGMLESVLGPETLTGDAAAAFDAATASIDVSALQSSFGALAPMVLRRLARQAAVAADSTRRAELRAALTVATAGLAVVPRAGEAEEEGQSDVVIGATPKARDAVTEWHSATVDALYLIAQAEPTALAAIESFTRDLVMLGRNDASHLRHVRGALERMVADRPLTEALACVPLLAEARSV